MKKNGSSMVKGKRKKNTITKLFVGALLATSFFALGSEVSANTWYSSSNITLPRNGWWTSINRSATSGTQGTRATADYDVVSNIETSYGTQLSDNEVHEDSSNVFHNTGVSSGDSIRSAFRTRTLNQLTTQSDLSWRP